MLRVPPRRIGRAGYRSELRVVLVVVAVAQRRLGPSSSASTSTVARPPAPRPTGCWPASSARRWRRTTSPSTLRHPPGGQRRGAGDADRHRRPGGGHRRPGAGALPGAGPGGRLRGLRWGELAGLRRKRVDLERGTVTVAEQLLEVNGTFSVGPPKSAAGRRTVALPAVVVEALRRHAPPGCRFARPTRRRSPTARAGSVAAIVRHAASTWCRRLRSTRPEHRARPARRGHPHEDDRRSDVTVAEAAVGWPVTTAQGPGHWW
jgi:hypothetical protein